MSGPSVTATILVDDQASPAMKQMVELAKMIAKETNAALKGGNGDAYAAQFRNADAAAKNHLGTLTTIRNMHKDIAAVAVGVATGKVAHVTTEKVIDYGKYEKGVRYQGIVGNYNVEERKALDEQRQKFATQQGFKPDETLHAQNALVSRDFKADVVVAATDKIMLLAKALDITGEAAAKIAEGKAFGEGHHIETADDAKKVMQRVADRSVIMNKRGAMTPDDISQNSKFSASTARVGNFLPEQADAYAMVLKRNQVGGDMSGVSFRGLATHLIAPTAGGLSSLDSMGIKHSDFSKNGSLSVDNTNQALTRKFGKGLGEAGKAHLQAQLDDEESKVIETDTNYASAVVSSFEKDGVKLSKTDQKNVAKAAREQFQLVRQGFDGAGLLKALLAADPSLQQLIPLVGPKNAGNVGLVTKSNQQFNKYKSQLDGSDGITEEIASKRNEGLGASLDRLAASADNAEKNLVRVAQVPLEGLTNFATKIINLGDALPDNVKMGLVTGGILGLGSAALGSVAGVVSLGASAAGAAVALNVIAARGALPGIAPSIAPGASPAIPAGAAPAAAAAGSAGSKLAGVVGAGARALGVAGIVAAVTPIIYELLNDKAQGVQRDHSKPNAARSAIRKDAEERLAREIARNDELQREAALRGDAKVEASNRGETKADGPNRRGGSGAMRRQLRDEGTAGEAGDESKGLNTAAPINVVSTVTGDLTGSANITANIVVTPSPLFNAVIEGIKADVLRLKGQVGTSKTGVNLAGSNGAQPVSNPSGGHH